MALSKEKLPNTNMQDEDKSRKLSSARPSGVVGLPISSRPSGLDARSYDSNGILDELGYGRIVRVVKASKKTSIG